MSVNQLMFLLLVFASLFLYYLVPKKAQWGVLLVISLYFYHLLGVDNFFYIILTTLTVYAGTTAMTRRDEALSRELKERQPALTREEKKEKKAETKKKKGRILKAIIIVNLGVLLVVKYGNFFLENVGLLLGLFGINFENRLGLLAPLGISYYTLQAIGYALEVYKGKASAEKNPLKVLLFLTYYPQMTQGPIGRWKDLSTQLFVGRSFEFENLARGCQLILWGLFKKAVVGDNLKATVTAIFGGYESLSGLTLLLGCMVTTLQLYADFSGYTDLVRGISKLYGIDLMDNFQRPFFAQSLEEYWRRWHISLSSWFRDYVFYPASISKGAVRFTHFGQKHFSQRVSRLCPVIYAMAIVWFCTGFWHDASWRYIFWGIGNGVVLISSILLEPWFTRMKEKLHVPEKSRGWQVFGMIRTFLIVAILKVFPSAEDTSQSLGIIKRIFCSFWPELNFRSAVFASRKWFLVIYKALFPDTKWFRLTYAAVGLAVFFVVSVIQERHGSVDAVLSKKPFAVRFAVYFLLLGILVFMGNFDTVVTGGFEYAQF